MTAPIGWVADRFGRKKLFIVCTAGFTFASVLCGFAGSIGEMVAFRLLQGMFGAALVPLSQAVLLDSYSAEERGSAMAIWGIGVMLGPIMGPTLGAWLTENYNWHWVFFINVPVGIVTVIGLMLFMDETKQQTHLRFDWFGFLSLAVGIGALQLMLDRGEQLAWFGSGEIVAETIVSVAGFYFFFAHSLTTERPFVRFDIFKDRNYVGGCLFMVVIGLVLFGTMALVTPFMQNVLGYPILTAGFLLAARGVGTLVSMMLVGRLMKVIAALPGARRHAARRLHTRPDGRLHRPDNAAHHRLRECAARLRPWPRVRAALNGCVRDASRAPAHRRHRYLDAGAQSRQLDWYLGGDRRAHLDHQRHARPSR